MKLVQILIAFLLLAVNTSCSKKSGDSVRENYPPEVIKLSDKLTGASIHQLTNYKGNSHHFYFTNPAWFDKGQKLLFSSDRNNKTNLFSVDLNDYNIQQITDLEPLIFPKEIGFFGACKNPAKDQAFYWYDTDLVAMDLTSFKSSVIYTLEPGWKKSMTSCSADGKYVYFSISEDLSHLFEVDILRGYVGFEETWEAKPLCKIIRVASDGSSIEVMFEENNWIGHVNTSPTRSDLITFCHEGPWAKVDNRIWGLNTVTKEVWKIRPRTHEGERVGHEYWFADGETLGYHGTREDGSTFLGRIRYDNSGLVEVDFSKRTGHIHSNGKDLIVGDGGAVIRLWKWNGETYDGPRILCEHNSSLKTQHSHPHPRFNAAGDKVIYTSDVTGYCNVYQVDIVEFESLPGLDE